MRLPAEARISPALFERLIGGCRSKLPSEACGILLGGTDSAVITVSDLIFIPNASASPGREFAFEPEAWVSAAYAAQKSRREIVGFFHSHPKGPPIPSRQDRIGWDGFGSCWIVGLGSPSAELRVFMLDGDDEWQDVRLTVR